MSPATYTSAASVGALLGWAPRPITARPAVARGRPGCGSSALRVYLLKWGSCPRSCASRTPAEIRAFCSHRGAPDTWALSCESRLGCGPPGRRPAALSGCPGTTAVSGHPSALPDDAWVGPRCERDSQDRDLAAGQACDQCEVEQVSRCSSGVGPADPPRARIPRGGPSRRLARVRGEAEPAGMLIRASTCLPSVSSLAVTKTRPGHGLTRSAEARLA